MIKGGPTPAWQAAPDLTAWGLAGIRRGCRHNARLIATASGTLNRSVNGNENSSSILNPSSRELRGVMNSPDQDTLLRAVEDARRIH